MFALYRRHKHNSLIEQVLMENEEWCPVGKEDPYRVNTWPDQQVAWDNYQATKKWLDPDYEYYVGEYSIY